MFVILAYDVRAKRVNRVRKTVRKYLRPVQRSVFDGFLSEGKLKRLKQDLQRHLDCAEDSVRIYKFLTLQEAEVDELGVVTGSDSVVL